MKKKISTLGFLGLLLTSLIINVNNFSSLLLTNDNLEYYNEINVRTAGFWNLTGSPIVIDDLNPSINWSYTASNYDWCSGSGTLSDPYLIENVTIDGQGSGNCIEISNSNVYFILKNCTVYNSGSISSGIFLTNTNKGKKINNYCMKHGSYGIYLYLSDNNTLSGNKAINNINAGIYLYLSDNNMLSGNTANNTNVGINLWFSNNAVLSGNTVNNNTNNGIYLVNSNNTRLSGNTANNTNNGIYLGNSNNATLSGNTVNNNVNNGIYLAMSNNVKLSGNMANNTNNGIYLEKSNNATLSGNMANNTNVGINLWSSNNAELSGNTVYNSTYNGIFLGYSNNALLSGNTVNNSTSNGIYLAGSNNTMLSENTVNNNTNFGIYLEKSNNATLSGNTVNNKAYNGIYLRISNNATLSGNTVNNTNMGISLWNSNNTMLSGNKVNNNNYGIYIGKSINNIVSNSIIRNNKQWGIFISAESQHGHNLFFKNYFINNTIHARDNTMVNYWNNSVIGNYWDTYTGIDVDNNGIGDTPYIFFGGTDYLLIVDFTTPIIIVNFPNSKDVFGNIAPNFNVEVISTKLDTMWYSLNGGKNITFSTNGTIDQTEWNALPDGNVSVFFYANDTFGNIRVFELIIQKDTTPPQISILTPELNEEFGQAAPTFNILIEEQNLDKMWYIIEGIDHKNFIDNTIGTIDQALWDSLSEGDITLRFYANDTVGNVDYVELVIIKTISPPIPQIPGYNLFILIGAIIAVILIVNKKNLFTKL